MAQRKRRATQQDIARLAGVSQATVSMVINGGASADLVATTTREAVMAAALELRYTANPAARSLRGGRNNLLGLYTFESVFPTDDRDFYYPFLKGVEEQTARLGYDLILYTSAGLGRRTLHGERMNRLRMADGCILLGRHVQVDDLEQLAAEHLPFVFIGRREAPGVQIPYVAPDYATATGQLVDHLVGLGHRKIVYLASGEEGEPSRDRATGFEAAMSRHGLEPLAVDRYVSAAELREDRVQRWLDKGATGLLIEPTDDPALLTALEALARSASFRIPDDLSVALLGDPASWEPGPLDWTRYTLPREEIARAAVTMLVEILDDGAELIDDADTAAASAEALQDAQRSQILPCTLVKGDTCAPPSPSQLGAS